MTDKVVAPETPTTDKIPAPTANKPKGTKRAPGKPKRAVEVEFKPNAYAPVLTVFPFRAPDAYHDFDHDASGLFRMAIDGSDILNNVSAHRYPGLNPAADVYEGLKRLVNLLVSKKLTYAAPHLVQNTWYDDFKGVKNCEIHVPSFLRTLAEGFGKFEHNSIEFTPRDIPLHQFNHFAYAAGVLNANGMPAAFDGNFFVNAQMAHWPSLVRARSARIIERWCEASPRVVVPINGVNHNIKPPSPQLGVLFPNSWTADLTAVGIVPPADVAAHAALVSLIDISAFRQGVSPVAPNVAVFNNAGYWMLRWNAQTLGARLAQYQVDWELRFSGLWRTAFVLDLVKSMEDKGRAWQLVSVSEDTMLGMSAFSVSTADQVTAYMLARDPANVKLDVNQMRFGVGEKTSRSARVEMLRKASVSKEFV